MANTSARRWIFAALAAASVALLYLTNLTAMGMYSTDEPRYADIGRAMARTGDWITPRLWGQPWFEKPPLLYWMSAIGFRLGLGPDLAPRLPMALLSIAFLAFFWWRLRGLWDERVAAFSTAILATTGGWLAYSHVAVTDIPVAVFFTAAVLLSLSRDGEEPHRAVAAACLGLAVLAKSIPPLVLFTPVLFFDRSNWKRWFASWPILVFTAVALPWHIAATIRNGWELPRVLFIEQQFGRFLTPALQHGQPWWFYLLVFPGLLFPWCALLPLAFRQAAADRSRRTLAAILILGLIFFSASLNKLPGYVLPLVPAACVLLGAGLAASPRPARWLIAPITLLGALPFASAIIPQAAAIIRHPVSLDWSEAISGLALAAVLAVILFFGLRSLTVPAAFLLAAAGFFWLQTSTFPKLDRAASTRPLWLQTHPSCAPVLPRSLPYGLYYYSEKQLPACGIVDKNALPPGVVLSAPQHAPNTR
ncbi:MAG TPA: glycosyltransferase family 39 protein [Bryobacteraceae bacterium]|nr:glycosyltransferase family 39 protein [Bryobacteraceae bacterium]